jgi:hypothetical protein
VIKTFADRHTQELYATGKSKRFPPDKYEATLKLAGAASNAYTSDDRTVYHTTFSKEDLETLLDMEGPVPEPEYSPVPTETLAKLGEYNKNSANPIQKLLEVTRDKAFTTHTYKHTTRVFSKTSRTCQPVRIQLPVFRPLLPAGAHDHVAVGDEAGRRGS